jgi:hypothetical protein
MNLSHPFYQQLSDTEILSRLESRARDERKLQAEILHLLREVETRRLYVDLNFGSTFEYCVSHLRYSEGAASRRIAAMRLLSDLPEPREMEEKLKDGRISLTALTQAQYFFQSEKYERGRAHSSESKARIVERLVDQSKTEREKILVSLAPDALPRERARVVSETHTELKIVVDAETLQALSRIREIWSNALFAQEGPNPGQGALLKRMAEFVLERIEPGFGQRPIGRVSKSKRAGSASEGVAPESAQNSRKQDTAGPENAPTNIAAASIAPATGADDNAAAKRCVARDRTISRPVRREVERRDGHRCAVVDARTGQRCESRHRLELDHIRPYAMGGSNSWENLRLVCRAHNQRLAVVAFGKSKVGKENGEGGLRSPPGRGAGNGVEMAV